MRTKEMYWRSIGISLLFSWLLQACGSGGSGDQIIEDDEPVVDDGPMLTFDYTVVGLEGDGEVNFLFSHTELGVIDWYEPLSNNGTFPATQSVHAGSAIRIFVESPSEPEQVCEPDPAGLVLFDDVVPNVVITCTSLLDVNYTVTGLEHPIEVDFVASHETHGVTGWFESISSNGSFLAAERVVPGPGSTLRLLPPILETEDQVCVMDPAGLFEVGDSVANITITCDVEVEYTVSGLEGAGGALSFSWRKPETSKTDAWDEPLTSDGTFTATQRVPIGAIVDLLVDPDPTDPDQVCRTSPGSISVVDALSIHFDVVCETGLPIRYSVEGLEGSGTIVDFIMTVPPLDDGESRLVMWHERLAKNGSFTAERRAFPGGTLRLFVTPPEDPKQSCETEPGGLFDIPDEVPAITIRCAGSKKIPYTINGLRGTGGELTFTMSHETEGSETFVYPMSQDGEFETDEVPVEWTYLMSISADPVDPDQECLVTPDEPVLLARAEPGQPPPEVTPIEVHCAAPYRIWEFSDSSGTLHLDARTGGVVDEEFIYGGFAPDLIGKASGLDNTELFQSYFNDDEAHGVVFSNGTGFTYWLAAESPPAPPFLFRGVKQSHYADLATIWTFEKRSEDATFDLEITKINLMALDAGHDPLADGPHMSAQAEFAVRALVVDPVDDARNTFFHAGDNIKLYGEADPGDPFRTLWSLRRTPKEYVDTEIWRLADFDFDANAAIPDWRDDTDRVTLATANLKVSKKIEVDLSQVPVGATFMVEAETRLTARNGLSEEGHTLVFLRDPGEFDPGGDAPPVQVTTSGLVMLPTDPELAQSAAVALPPPDSCGVGDNLSTLAFEVDTVRLSEAGPELPPTADILITRSGLSAGPVSALVSFAGGTAEADLDFDADDISVRFGDGSTAPRRLSLPIVNDDDVEADETLTLTLHSPMGCAIVGGQASLEVTLVDDDGLQGSAEFTQSVFEASEADGTASVELFRDGGTQGVAAATLRTADGTATSADYAAVETLVVFGDGDSSPKTVQIPLFDNNTVDGDRTVELTLTPANETSPVLSTATLVIQDDDVPDGGTIEFAADTQSVAEDAGSVNALIERGGSTSGSVSVEVSAAPNSASVGDFDFSPATVTFAEGEASQTISVAIVDDTKTESDEFFTVTLSAPTGGANLGARTTTSIVITDNDGVVTNPPAAPDVSAATDTKSLEFTWGSVDDVTSYRLMQDDGSGFAQVGDDIAPQSTFVSVPVSVHLLGWQSQQFVVEACNSAGCTASAPVDALGLMLGSIGFFKASNTDAGDVFGVRFALSADGSTLAVAATREASTATHLNGDQTSNALFRSGAVYLFELGSSGWSQTTYVKASDTARSALFGSALALSGSGDVLVVGAMNLAAGSASNVGAAYVYLRSGGAWSFSEKLTAINAGGNDHFGTALSISEDGNIVIVGAPGEASSAVGVGGDTGNNDASDAGAAYIYTRDAAGYVHSAYLKASNTDAFDGFGTEVAIDQTGTRVVVGAPGEGSLADGIDGDQSDNSATGDVSGFKGVGAAYVFELVGSAWTQTAYVKASNSDANDRFGEALALSSDGGTLAVAADREDGLGVGVNAGDQSDNSAGEAGAVYVFDLDQGGVTQSAYVKASNTQGLEFFGGAVALSEDGDLLVVGAPAEKSTSNGVNGDQSQIGSLSVGAVYVFERENGGEYTQRTYVKPSNADQDGGSGFGRSLGFGGAVTVSRDGATLVVGAPSDGSADRGINGDQSDSSASGAGAVFVY